MFLATDASAITLWTAVAAIGTVGSLWLLIGQLWLLRRDRRDDYPRALIPFLSMDLYNDNPAVTSTPVRVYVDGRGIAYNVLIDLRTTVGLIPANRNLSTRLRHSALEITEPLSPPPAVC